MILVSEESDFELKFSAIVMCSSGHFINLYIASKETLWSVWFSVAVLERNWVSLRFPTLISCCTNKVPLNRNKSLTLLLKKLLLKMSSNFIQQLELGLANFLNQGPDSKIFRICLPTSTIQLHCYGTRTSSYTS